MTPTTPEEFKNCLSLFTTGITVVTFLDSQNQPQGITVNSFNTVSLDPPLILFSIDKKSQLIEEITKTLNFTVNILSYKNKDISHACTSPRTISWDAIEHTTDNLYGPTIENTLSTLACKHETSYEGGDHTIIIGRVEKTKHNKEEKPLIYYNREYYSL